MPDSNSIEGNQNLILDSISNSHMTIAVNNNDIKYYFIVLPNHEDFTAFLGKHPFKQIQIGDKLVDVNSLAQESFIASIKESNIEFEEVPAANFNEIFTFDSFRETLRTSLRNEQIQLPENAEYGTLIQCYGWLIEPFLRKLGSSALSTYETKETLSYLVEAHQVSLRFLCFIQISNIFIHPHLTKDADLFDFFNLNKDELWSFDYAQLLIKLTRILNNNGLVTQIHALVDELENDRSTSHQASGVLKTIKNYLLPKAEFSPAFLKEQIAKGFDALAEWMDKISFLCHYHLVSIKDISMRYRFGTKAYYTHSLGQLYGIYTSSSVELERKYAYTHSVILYKGSLQDSIKAHDEENEIVQFLSLSPFVIDKSVYINRATHTPEIYYYIGFTNRQCSYVYCEQSLIVEASSKAVVDRTIVVKLKNPEPNFNDLYRQIEEVFLNNQK